MLQANKRLNECDGGGLSFRGVLRDTYTLPVPPSIIGLALGRFSPMFPDF
jgi:hypothetical protein